MVKKKNTKRTIILTIIILLLVAAGWAYSVWVRIYDNPNGDYTRDPSIVDEPGKNITNVLILGVDAENGESGRADSIIVMSLNRDTDEVALISIPRDSRVEIPDRGLDKINHAFAYKGISLMRPTVESLLGVPIHHYIYTDFTGFKGIVDSVGGVHLDVERKITSKSGKLYLSPGPQRLYGDGALQYVRFRSDGEGDFGRMRRQQHLLKSLAGEILQTGSILKMPSLLEQFARFVRTDMTITQLMAFSRTAANLDLDEVTAIQLKGSSAMINKVSYVILDEDNLQETINKYLRWND
jgi:LCP family protein required for cell wall assembly